MQDLTIEKSLCLASQLSHLDREVLLSHVLKKERTFLLSHDETALSTTKLKKYRSFLARAMKNEPIAYIIGEKEFYGRKFFVGTGVLIPRPETEILVEHAIENISKFTNTKKKCAVIDVGTGSGAIITSIFLSLTLSQRKKIDWYGLEKESIALRYARKNAKHHRVEQSIHFMKSDLLSAIEKKLGVYDEIFIVANLPYLSTKLYGSTEPNVKKFEPKSALISGAHGLAHYQRLMRQLLHPRALGTNVHFFLEISPEQAIRCSEWLSPLTLPQSLHVIPDLAGKNRIVSGTLI